MENEIIEVTTVKQKELNYLENNKCSIICRESQVRIIGLNILMKMSLLYIKYNSCREDDIPLKDKISNSIDFIEKNNISKITIDLRNNLGGDSTLLAPLVEVFKK